MPTSPEKICILGLIHYSGVEIRLFGGTRPALLVYAGVARSTFKGSFHGLVGRPTPPIGPPFRPARDDESVRLAVIPWNSGVCCR